MKVKFIISALFLLAGVLMSQAATQHHLVLSTENTSIGITANEGGRSYIQYYGAKIDQGDIRKIFALGSNFTSLSYPTFGIHLGGGAVEALSLQMPDGNMSTDLFLQSVEKKNDAGGECLVLTMIDSVYPVTVKQYFKAYNSSDVISTWTEISNKGKKSILMNKFASAAIPLQRGDNYVCHYHGKWASENYMFETPMPNGQLVLDEKEGLRTAWYNNPSFMITADGKPQEECGEVFGATLLWGGNYKIQMVAENNKFTVVAGINNDNSAYTLEAGETFTTPEFAMTYSTQGKGGVSRAFHRWGRKYALQHGGQVRDILLNSWEGVYFQVNQEKMDQMMQSIASLGGELFVMDDGWFGEKYPRNDGTSSLGDWGVNKGKLPLGVKGLTDAAKKHGVKFGIWIEPEMANTKSELYEKHPDWILQCKNRELTKGRGRTQVVLDLCNPKVQDFVFSITDNLLTENPEIAYIKWDCNAAMMDYGSTYLSADRQSEVDIRYHMGLRNVLKRIREKYPDVVIQCCSSGGGRISYGFLPWFDEFWTSDNTDAYQRLYMQWSASQFYPAIAMASHVSASPNHQTSRVTPIKFRFDVAMTGRLGMEMQPKDMTTEEIEFSKRAIASYKSIREVVQLGDLYRLVSPYDHKSISALMYANDDKSHLAVFAYSLEYTHNQQVPYVRLTGVDENKNYRIKDLTPWNVQKPCFLDNKVVSGRALKYAGLKLKDILNRPFSSVALELVAE